MDRVDEYSRLQTPGAATGHELWFEYIVCPNQDCKKFTLTVSLVETEWSDSVVSSSETLRRDSVGQWRLIPESAAKVFPELVVPKAVRADYVEACLIQDNSPKASATLSRRCLQTMIRDFWKVTGKPNLKQEIDAIQNDVANDTWDAIHSVREVGNIGAHMEKDVNLIVEVDSNEAGLLIWLIEYLIDDWYIQRHERAEKLKSITDMAASKQQARQGGTTGTP